MLQYLDQVEDSSRQTDVCIIGAGPAGITLALELAAKEVDVVLLEAGGLAPPGPGGLDLYEGKVTGREYPFQVSRLRYFGGTSGHWGGWCRPLDESDFSARENIEFSGWPISRSELLPWYEVAHHWLQIASSEYFVDKPSPFADSLLPETSGIVNRYFRFSPPTRFGTEYQSSVSESEGIRCFLGANASRLQRDDRGEITSVLAHSLDGKSLTVTAAVTVLAMGGIENARFLLNSEEDPAQAVGNHSDWLGRGFMDHGGWSPGVLIARSDLVYQRFTHNNIPIMPVLGIAPRVLVEHDLINCCGLLQPRGFVEDVEPGYFRNAWFGKGQGMHEVDAYRLQLIFEPSPCRDSRVMLGREKDALGLRRTHLHWAFNQADFVRLGRTIDYLSVYFGKTGLGRIKLTNPVNQKSSASRIDNGWHHMGTTRMSTDPASGVVDENCLVHQTRNLYIAGSSVFPSVGFSNPTLTIVALACRLAAHLRGVLTRA